VSPATRPARKPAARKPPTPGTKGRRAASATIAGDPLTGDDLAAAILRSLRRDPNRAVNLEPLADQLGVDPVTVQLAVERLHQRRMLTAPFIEPGRAGGGELTQVGLRWLIEREGGKPKDVPVAVQPATGHVRAQDEAARLPRAQVYGVRRRA